MEFRVQCNHVMELISTCKTTELFLSLTVFIMSSEQDKLNEAKKKAGYTAINDFVQNNIL